MIENLQLGIISKINIKRRYSSHKELLSGNPKNYLQECTGTMTERDIIIREVTEVGFSPYVIFKDIIKDEYNHIFSYYFANKLSDKVIETIKKYFDLTKFSHRTYTTINRSEHNYKEDYYFSAEEKVYISVNDGEDDTNIIMLSTELSQEIKDLSKELEALKEKKKKSSLSIICFNRTFYTEDFDISVPKTENVDFFDCYNEEFKDISDKIKQKLSQKNGKGIVLFHGGVGTGKTSYLRYLISEITDKKLIYMPPDLTDKISSPEFVTFLMENPNSILIIEDAENVLKAREAGGSQAVSNLLNVSDGILGDALHLQIVCTFNCSQKDIDQALLRPGRLIAEYKFDNLNVNRANILAKKLYGNDVFIEEPISLAELFNKEETLIKTKENKVSFGFIPQNNKNPS